MAILKLWKDNMENKGLHVIMGKTKVTNCGKGLDTIKPSGKCLCSVCRKGVERNSIFCRNCDAWFIINAVELQVGLLIYQISNFRDI